MRISQTEMTKYFELRAEIDRMEKRKKTLRDDLVQRIEQGAIIETGRLTATVFRNSIRRFSEASLQAVLGCEFVAALKNQMTEQEQVRLYVEPDAEGRRRKARSAQA